MFQDFKKLIKYFVFIFLISFLLINFNEVVLFSSYEVIGHSIKSIKQETNIAEANISEATSEAATTSKESRIEIPKIGVSAPLILPNSDNEKELEKLLKSGTLLYPNFSLPGENGQTIILGHSAPLGWPDIYYDNIFSDIGKLEKGDKIFIYYNNREYVFKVNDRVIFYPNDEDKYLLKENSDNSLLTLLTCWPPGKNLKRLAVFAIGG